MACRVTLRVGVTPRPVSGRAGVPPGGGSLDTGVTPGPPAPSGPVTPGRQGPAPGRQQQVARLADLVRGDRSRGAVQLTARQQVAQVLLELRHRQQPSPGTHPAPRKVAGLAGPAGLGQPHGRHRPAQRTPGSTRTPPSLRARRRAPRTEVPATGRSGCTPAGRGTGRNPAPGPPPRASRAILVRLTAAPDAGVRSSPAVSRRCARCPPAGRPRTCSAR